MKRFLRIAARAAWAIVFLILAVTVGTGVVLSVSGAIQNKSARARATGEIQEMSVALENYNTDFGNYPQDPATDALDPRVDFDPVGGASGTRFHAAGLTLYSALSGDFLPAGKPDGKPEKKAYLAFRPDQLQFVTLGSGAISVSYVKDPYGNCYGYSTAGNAQETKYRTDLQSHPALVRPSPPRGYNSTFDLWSTSDEATNAKVNRWVRNWAE